VKDSARRELGSRNQKSEGRIAAGTIEEWQNFLPIRDGNGDIGKTTSEAQEQAQYASAANYPDRSINDRNSFIGAERDNQEAVDVDTRLEPSRREWLS